METLPRRPASNHRAEWQEYWNALGMPWRKEPEIDSERQRFLSERRMINPDVRKGKYPFRDQNGSIELHRADLEWLLATHESDGVVGPVEWANEQHQHRTGLDLRGADLRKAKLERLPLARAQLSFAGVEQRTYPDPITDEQASWSVAQVGKLTVVEAELQGAYLNGLDLEEVHLEETNLERAEISGANLSGAFIKSANLCRADLSDSTLDDARILGSIRNRTKLNHANLTNASFENVEVEDMEAIRADFTKAKLKDSSFIRSHLEFAVFEDAHLANVRIRPEIFEPAEKVHLVGARFKGAHLQGSFFEDVVLSGCSFEKADLSGAKFVDARFAGSVLPIEQVEIIKPWISQENLDNIRRGAILTNAQLDRNTQMIRCVFTDRGSAGAYLESVRWNGARLGEANWESLAQLGNEFTARHPSQEVPLLYWVDSIGQGSGFANAEAANIQLANVLKGSDRLAEAQYFEYRASLCHLSLLRKHLRRNFLKWALSEIAWATTGYGYKLWRIIATYLFSLVFFAFIYWRQGVHSPGAGESSLQALWDSFLISLSAIHGRTVFEPIGAWSAAAWTAGLESVWGIVIEALFVAMLIQRLFRR